MKKLYYITKVLLTVLVVIYVFALLFYPVTMALFTTDGYASGANFIRDLLESFAVSTPLMAIVFIPFLWLRSFVAYKLSYIDERTFVNRTYAMSALEVIIILGFLIFIIILQNSMGSEITQI